MSGAPLAVLPDGALTPGRGGLSPHRPAGLAIRLRDLVRDATDARRYVRRTLWLTLALYALLGAAFAGYVSPWIFPLVVPLIYVRLSLSLHELMHVRTAARVSWFHRLAMIFDTPLGLGYREHRAIHLQHHRYPAEARDPELYQIRGSTWTALVNATIAPEHAAWAWVRRHGVSTALRREAAVRLAFFFTLLAIDPAVFFAYWLTLRVCIGASGFVFHHVLHYRSGRLGSFGLPALPAAVPALARVLFGHEPIAILAEHRAHHAWPSVRARDLPRARQWLQD
jgi:fatty acid desaturase